jgi:hypothetical protein
VFAFRPNVLNSVEAAPAEIAGQSEIREMPKVRNNGPVPAGEETDGSRLPRSGRG